MVVLKRLGVLSVAKLQALTMAVFGLLIGLIYAFIGIIASAIGGGAEAALGIGLSLLAIIFVPIIYGIFGFIVGAIGAFVYNLFAGWVGGIEMEFSQ